MKKFLMGFILTLFCLNIVHAGKKIIGGQEANLLDHPWYVKIPGCGAVIISKRHLLTAAHCWHYDYNTAAPIMVGGEYRNYGVISFQIHPKYESSATGYDIALITLKDEIVFSEKVDKIQLASHDELPQVFDEVNISGMGLIGPARADIPDKLQEVNLKLYPPFSDESYWDKRVEIDGRYVLDKRTYHLYLKNLSDSVLPLYSPTASACMGDSGGPAIFKLNEVPYLIGITSFSTRVREHETPLCTTLSVYTKIPSHLEWIKEEMEKL